MDKEITFRDFVLFIVLLVVAFPVITTFYNEKKEEKQNEIKEHVEENVIVSSDLPSYSINDMYSNSCLNQTYCPDGNNIYVKYGDFTFAIFKKQNEDSVLGILTNTYYNGHVLNDYSCEQGFCTTTYVKLNSSSSGITDVLNSFENYLPNNKNEVLTPISYSTGYIDSNNKFTDDVSYKSYVSLINWKDYQEVGSRSYMFNIDTLLSTVRYAEPVVTDSVDHYWSNGGASRLSGIYVSNGTRTWVSPLNRSNYPMRPIISINTKTKILDGEGTIDKPYII